VAGTYANCAVAYANLHETYWRKQPLKSLYPSKSFLTDAKTALNDHALLEIAIMGWRGKTLAREVRSWAPTEADVRAGGGQFKHPSMVISLFMIPLLTIHWMALSAQYEMHSMISGDDVELSYVPL
jgi:hypothetical protein